MLSTQVNGKQLNISLDENHTDLRLCVGPKEVCFNEPGQPEQCLLREKVESVQIEVQSTDGIIEVDTDLASARLPSIEIGKVEQSVTVYGEIEQVEVKKSETNVLLVSGDTPDEIKTHQAQILNFHYEHRPVKSTFDKLKASFLRFVGRDAKLGVNSFGELFSLVQELCEEKSPKRIVAEYFAKRRHADIHHGTLGALERVLEPGDILLRYQRGFPLDRYVVGLWQHAGACIDDQANVIDALGEGVDTRPLARFAHADAVVVLRPEFSPIQKIQFLNYLKLQSGKGYNYDFSANTSEHYCSGLVYHALEHCGFAPRRANTVHPDELLKLPGIRMVWTNRLDLVVAATTAKKIA